MASFRNGNYLFSGEEKKKEKKKEQFCAEQSKNVVPFRTVKRQQMHTLCRPSSQGSMRLIAKSSEHDELGTKLPELNRDKIRLGMPSSSLTSIHLF